MSAVNLLILIIPRELTDGYGLFLREAGIKSSFSFPCEGTASSNFLRSIGLEQNRKTLIWAMLEETGAKKTMRRCISDMGLNMPGNGIAMRIPIQAVGGETALKALTEGRDIRREEGTKMEQKTEFPNVLITAICENGHSDDVMKAAREAGAGGGTVIHAKGTANLLNQAFRGISLAEEKDMVLILSARNNRDAIMRAIMDKTGIDTPAHAIVFALPVESVAGLRRLMPEDEEEEKEEKEAEEEESVTKSEP